MKRVFLIVLLTMIVNSIFSQTPVFETAQYQKALWMTTRFYGAQRMGNGTNWLVNDLMWMTSDAPDWIKSKASQEYYNNGKSFVRDADGSYDLTGGWFDCGDFVLFGQTFYYSTYMLLLGYSEFQDGYQDLYSDDYNGYITAGNFTWEGNRGKSNDIPDILDECKYATDFIKKAVRDDNTFYYEKGNGDYDHQHWCTSVMKSSFKVSDGGESDGKRDFGKATQYATSMACLAGASLAAMYRIYKDYDLVYAYECLNKAKTAYNFATKTAMGNSKSAVGSYYPAKDKYLPDLTILCAELYRATEDETYLNKCNEYTKQWISDFNHNYVLCYNNTEDIALYAYCAMGEGNTYYNDAKAALKTLVGSYPSNNNVLTFTQSDWGPLRYVANEAFAWALYSKLSGETSVNEKVLRTVEYILGSNSKKFSYVVGVNGNGTTDFPLYPHHRNFYRSDCGDESKLTMSASYKYIQFGYLVGGSVNDGEYTDSETNYQMSEGGIDYNCGLVGALGYICSKIAKVEASDNKTITSISVKTLPNKTVYNVGDQLDVTGGVITINYSNGTSENKNMTTAMVSGFNSKTGGTKTITISYSGKSATFAITVNVAECGIEIFRAPQTEYLVGDDFDVTNATLKLLFNDGSYKTVEMTEDMVSGFSSDEVGIYTVKVTYKTWQTDLTVTILKCSISSIELYKTPTKTEYNQGDTLDVSGGKIYVIYDDNTEDVIELTKQMVTNFESSVPGSYSIEIRYGSFILTYDITINEVETDVEVVNHQVVNIYSYEHTIYLIDVSGRVEVFNMMGRRVFSGSNVTEITINQPGIYIVRTSKMTKKVAIY